MSSHRRLRSRPILLPWERRSAWVAQVAFRRRMIAALIASVALGVCWFAYRSADDRARTRATRAAIAEAHRAVTAFVAELGRCPHSTVELMHPPKAGAHYLNELPVDGWGRPLYIRCPGRTPDDAAEVFSAGPRGSFLLDEHIL
ncbi:MAG TPA: type II secretion system protein GspG [Polyangiales bacterium]|jgi:type II secretory pathway pseudopilin PulG|nr:type II secretion system protein GspG [Polyangiales bacterium]